MGYLHCRAYWPTDGLPSLLSLLTYCWATSSVEPTKGLHSLPSLLMSYPFCRAYWWATYSVKPTDGLPSLPSLLMGYLHCIAYWWATFTAEPTDGLPSLYSLLMGYLLCRAYWWAPFFADIIIKRPCCRSWVVLFCQIRIQEKNLISTLKLIFTEPGCQKVFLLKRAKITQLTKNRDFEPIFVCLITNPRNL